MIAALYVDARGPYADMAEVDPWPEARDARNYAGPHAVVAHPPCQLWVNLAHVNFKRYGKAHNLPANDGGMFAHALACVRAFGGVLEHPAGSAAWSAFALTEPGTGWQRTPQGDWVCEVWQSAYGHKARKRTWLLYVGGVSPLQARWEREPGTHQCGWFDRIKPTLSKREASRTPDAFAHYLVELAQHSAGIAVADELHLPTSAAVDGVIGQ